MSYGGGVMKRLFFQVEFKSDVVLQATSNNEGKIESLDFIPGSNFLGIVASRYGDFSNSFDIFHSGKVRFGDATLLYDGKLTYKMPLSFFHEKLDDSRLFNHHLISNFKQFTQLKQKRKGFITRELDEVSIKHNYTQKSAYDKEHRRSKDSSMYGYNALPSGLVWQFEVRCDDSVSSEDIALIKESLVGQKRLGKSKSSQYGQVVISAIDGVQEKIEELEPREETLLYLKSRVALVDSEGNPTYDLSYLVDGLDEKSIVWEKSQIRTSSFTPYNRAMETKCYERMVIDAGSVIVLRDVSGEVIEKIKRGVGVYLAEGFGEILVNPQFLLKEEFSFRDDDKENSKKKGVAITHPVAKFLEKRQAKKEAELAMVDGVKSFINRYKKLYANIKNAQWGTIRSICTSGSKNYIEEIREYIQSGKVSWRQEQIDALLPNESYSLEFIKLLSIEIPKVNGGAENEN